MLMLSIAAQAQTVRGSVGIIGKVGHWIDAATGKGIDSSYIEVPERPWQVIAKGIANQSDLHMKSTFDGSQMYQGVVGDVTVEPRIRTAISRSAGLWVGYRGWGIGYSASIGSNKGVDWDIETASASYYVKLRLHSFEGGDFETRMSGYMADPEDETATPEPFEVIQPLYLSSPVKIKTQLLEGVYIFNSSRFSYTAAYDQSVIQRRSAGSLAAGLRYFHSDYDYAHDSNADLILNMNDIGRINTWQLSIGAGYAYNWVPARGWLISAMAVPMLTFYNRITVCTYDLDISEDMKDYRLIQTGEEHINNRVSWNFDTRLALSYQWRRYYLRAYSHYNHFRYHNANDHGYTSYWTVYSAFGFRF